MNHYNRGGRPQQNMNNDYRGGNDRYNDGYNQNHHGRDGRDYGRDGRGNSSRSAGNNYNGTFRNVLFACISFYLSTKRRFCQIMKCNLFIIFFFLDFDL